MFLKATQIDKIIDTLTSNAETYEAAKQRLNDFEKEINVIQTKHLKLESQVKAIKSLQPMKVNIYFLFYLFSVSIEMFVHIL